MTRRLKYRKHNLVGRQTKLGAVNLELNQVLTDFCKVASSRLSWFVAHSRIFRLFMKGNVDAYVLCDL